MYNCNKLRTRDKKKCLLLWWSTKAIDVSVHQQSVVTLNELTPSGRLPQRNKHVLIAVTVVLTHDLLDGLRSRTSVVERNSGAVVVQDVGLDDIVEDVLSDETKLSVDGGSGTSGEVPLVGFVVRHLRVRVLQEGNEHKPVVNTEVWMNQLTKRLKPP